MLLSAEALQQRRDELLYSVGVAEAQLERIGAVLCSREPFGESLPPTKHHGTRGGYLAGCHCTCCCEANAQFQADARFRARLKPRKAETSTMPENPKIARPRVELAPGPRGMVYGLCWHCPWQVGPSVKSYVEERMIAHRKDHRAGLIAVTKSSAAIR